MTVTRNGLGLWLVLCHHTVESYSSYARKLSLLFSLSLSFSLSLWQRWSFSLHISWRPKRSIRYLPAVESTWGSFYSSEMAGWRVLHATATACFWLERYASHELKIVGASNLTRIHYPACTKCNYWNCFIGKELVVFLYSCGRDCVHSNPMWEI